MKKKLTRKEKWYRELCEMYIAVGPNWLWYVIKYGEKLGRLRYRQAAKKFDDRFKWLKKRVKL